MNRLIINNLKFSYRKNTVLSNFNIEIPEGINLLLGVNGSGKSTLFKILSCVLVKKEGKIYLNDLDYDLSNIRKNIAYIPQSFDVFPALKVKEFLTYVGEVKYKFRGSQLKEEVDKAIEMTGIADFASKKMKALSGGMKQRVGIAQALIGEPILILADEPTAGLDPEQRSRFNEILARVVADKIILISTHLIEEITSHNHIIIISDGKLKFDGTRDALIDSAKNKFYTIKISLNDYEGLAAKHTIISETFEGDTVVCKIIVEDDTQRIGVMNAVKPSLSDLWTYYR